MSTLFFKRDIHRSVEGLLYSLFVYQYFLDTSTIRLLLRCIVQDQVLSLKTKAPTLRIALYIVFLISFLALFRHLYTPDQFGIIIDFIGNISTPSIYRLLCLDLLIMVLQITEALIVFQSLKGSSDTIRSSTTSTTAPTTIPNSTSHSATTHSSGTRHQHPGRTQQRAPATSQLTGTSDMDGPSSPIFEYTPHPEDHDPTSEYYVDNEETRYSMDRQRSAQASSSAGPSGSRVPPLPTTSTATTSRRGGSSNQRTSSDSDITHSDSESDQDIDPLGDDYERVLEQETFVLQITIQDLVSYLVSSQDVISLPRLAESGSALASVTSRTAAEANSRVQNLPV